MLCFNYSAKKTLNKKKTKLKIIVSENSQNNTNTCNLCQIARGHPACRILGKGFKPETFGSVI